jgi:Na+-transporting NADH:ubiquinone oxidoreductase subunit B
MTAQRGSAKRLLLKQPAMRRVLTALVPCVGGSVYFFGWVTFASIIFCCAVGFVGELLFRRKRKQPVSEAVFVTAVLFALVMPPGVGWHVLGVGMVFAVIFSKEVFGGFGKNFFNPALAGRCFVYICFPIAMTGTWQKPADGPWGALGKWSTAQTADSVTSATPMAHLKAGRLILTDATDTRIKEGIPFKIEFDGQSFVSRNVFYKGLLFGRISGTAGVTSAVLILLGGVYLFYTKTASRTTILSVIISYAFLNELLYRLGVEPVPGALGALLGGGFLFGAFFMATDPVSSPRTEAGRVIYGVLIGVCTLVIRNFSIFNGGLMFSILLANMFAPIIDHAVRSYGGGKKAIPAEKEART